MDVLIKKPSDMEKVKIRIHGQMYEVPENRLMRQLVFFFSDFKAMQRIPDAERLKVYDTCFAYGFCDIKFDEKNTDYDAEEIQDEIMRKFEFSRIKSMCARGARKAKPKRNESETTNETEANQKQENEFGNTESAFLAEQPEQSETNSANDYPIDITINDEETGF